MSSLPTSDQMATTLGIKDGSFRRMNDELCQLRFYEGVPPAHPSFPPLLRRFLPGMKQRNDLIGSLEHLGQKDPTLLPEFAHFWLPELVEAHSVAVVADFNNPWTRVILFLGVNVNPIFDRYGRSSVDGVAFRESFYHVCGAQIEEHTIRLERLWSSNPTTSPQEAESYLLAGNRLQFLCNFALTEVVACRPPPSPSHSLSLNLLLSRIQRFLQIIQRSKRNVSPAHEQDLDTLTRTGSWTEGLLEGDFHEGSFLRLFGDRPWLGCAADAGAGGCIKLEGRSSMNSCSRCFAVRYCSVGSSTIPLEGAQEDLLGTDLVTTRRVSSLKSVPLFGVPVEGSRSVRSGETLRSSIESADTTLGTYLLEEAARKGSRRRALQSTRIFVELYR